MASAVTYWKGTDTKAKLTFKDESTGDPITTATVTLTIYNESNSDAQVGSPIDLPHTSGGIYEAVIPYNLAVNIGDRLRLNFYSDGGSNKRATDDLKAVVRVRNA